jgi:hypothetical protein
MMAAIYPIKGTSTLGRVSFVLAGVDGVIGSPCVGEGKGWIAGVEAKKVRMVCRGHVHHHTGNGQCDRSIFVGFAVLQLPMVQIGEPPA